MRRLLIGYDGSPCAEAALEDLSHAGLPAELEAMVLSVADVWLPPHYDLPGTEAEAAEAMARLPAALQHSRETALQAFEHSRDLASHACARLSRIFPKWKLQPVAVADSPAWAIIKKAAEWHADLIIVGSHGYSGLRRFLLGSVSQKVAAEADCSVRIARPRRHACRSGLRVAVAVTESLASEVTAQALAARAWPASTEFQIVAMMTSLAEVAASIPNHYAALWEELHNPYGEGGVCQIAQQLADALRWAGVSVEVRVLPDEASHLFLSEADEWEADCIFVAADGLDHARTHMLDSFASAAINRAYCTVEMIRATSA